jgi:hypothetical protein
VVVPILNQPSIGGQVRKKAANRVIITGDSLTSGLDIEPLTDVESQNPANFRERSTDDSRRAWHHSFEIGVELGDPRQQGAHLCEDLRCLADVDSECEMRSFDELRQRAGGRSGPLRAALLRHQPSTDCGVPA